MAVSDRNIPLPTEVKISGYRSFEDTVSVFHHEDRGVRLLKRWVINLPGCKILCPKRPLSYRFMCTCGSPCEDVRMMVVRLHNLQTWALCAGELSVSFFLPLFDLGKCYPKPAIMQFVSWNGTRSSLWRWYTRLTSPDWLGFVQNFTFSSI